MLFLIALVGAAVIALVLWKAMNAARGEIPEAQGRPVPPPSRPRVSGPDEDPDFLRQLDERARRQDEPPSA